MPLPSFVVTGNLKEILGDVSSSELVESAMTRAQIQFVSNIPSDFLVTWTDTMYRLGPVNAVVNTAGDIVSEDDEPVRLLAQHDDLNIRGLQWQFKATLPSSVIPLLRAELIRGWWFNAEGDGSTIDVKETIPVLLAPALTITDIDGGSP